MSLRLDETFELIERDLTKAGVLDYLRAGVFICGGGARIPQCSVFRTPLSAPDQRRPHQFHQRLEVSLGPTGVLHGHRVGQIRLLSAEEKNNPGRFSQVFRATFGGLLGRP
jgi:cell division ATPase FtsA